MDDKTKMIETLDKITDSYIAELAKDAKKKMFAETMKDLELIYLKAPVLIYPYRYLEGTQIKKDKIDGQVQIYYGCTLHTATKVAEELKKKDDYIVKKGALTGIAYATLKQLSEKDFSEHDQKKYLTYAAYCSVVSGTLEDQATKYLFHKIAEKKPELIPELKKIVQTYYKQ